MSDTLLPQDLDQAGDLLAQLFNEVSVQESPLSGEKGLDLGPGSQALQALRETKISFGNPTDRLIRLTPKLFENIGLELSDIYKRQMRTQFDFYYMTLAVSMQPKRGAQFSRLECKLDFGPKGEGEPIVQTIFPQSEWREVLNFGGGMTLALNGQLEWQAGLELFDETQLQDLPAQVKASIADKNNLKAFVTVPDYSFKLGRSDIAATGEGNSECFWRIEKPELQETQTVRFGIVFKVPKKTKTIDLSGLAAAEPDINWLTANVRNVFEDLSDKLQTLLRLKPDQRRGQERLPIGAHKEWAKLKLPN